VKAIGVSNFGPPLLRRLLKSAKVVPAANQMEMHPGLPLAELKALCDEVGVLLIAYSPLGPSPRSPRRVCTADAWERARRPAAAGRGPRARVPGREPREGRGAHGLVACAGRALVGRPAWDGDRVQDGDARANAHKPCRAHWPPAPLRSLADHTACGSQLVKLTDGEMAAISGAHAKPGMHRSLMPAPYHENGGVFGWTYEQLGWNMVEGGVVPEKK
jgi:glycerol 2-dehydrogenase (NADP+)